ncbi:MAG: hypothetical protein JO199_12650 [Candidatus Eremiobacteraeota bacterium]|nr:hypothetical protein [Candidatus Eremiobacteraeota bacterium]
MPITLTASATGATNAQTTFTPTLPAIQYSGPTVSNNPEIDLYNPTQGQPGYSVAITNTQPGWNLGTFPNQFSFQLGGTNNNCSSYSVSQTPNSNNQGLTVQVASTPVAGTCTMIVTGGANVNISVLLTYSTTGIGINLKHHHALHVKP